MQSGGGESMKLVIRPHLGSLSKQGSNDHALHEYRLSRSNEILVKFGYFLAYGTLHTRGTAPEFAVHGCLPSDQRWPRWSGRGGRNSAINQKCASFFGLLASYLTALRATRERGREGDCSTEREGRGREGRTVSLFSPEF